MKIVYHFSMMVVAGLFSLCSADTLWTQAIRFPGYNAYGHHCKETSDGGILMTGYVISLDTANPGEKGFLLKTTNTGELLWKVLYNDSVMTWGTSIIKADDNGYVIAGISSLPGDAGYASCDGVIIETDLQGVIKRRMVFDNGLWDAADFGVSTSDNGIIIAGLTQTGNPLSVNGWIFKTDKSGLVQWSKVIGDTNWDVCFDICQTNDHGYIATGYTESTDSSSQLDVWLIRLDSTGQIKWKRTCEGFSPSSTEAGNAVAQTADNGFVAAGFAGEKDRDVFIIRTDSMGVVLWKKKYGTVLEDEGTSLITMPDGGLLVAGTKTSTVDTMSDIWILRLDSKGDTIWTRTYGRAWNDYVERMTPMANGCCLIAGSTRLAADGERDAWLLKFSTDETKNRSVPPKKVSLPMVRTNQNICFEKTFSKSGFAAHGTAAKVIGLFDARGRRLSGYGINNAAGLFVSRIVDK